MDNPEKIWEHAFRDISSNSQALLYYLASLSIPISYKTIQSDFNSFYKHYCNKYGGSFILNPLKKSVKEIEDSFISLKRDRGSINISFINPGVNDFLESLIKKDIILSKNLIEICSFSSQAQKLLAIVDSKKKGELLDMLSDGEIQRSILELTKKEQMSIEEKGFSDTFMFNSIAEKGSSNIFSFIFNYVSDEFISSNKFFLEGLLNNLMDKFKSPMYKGNVSLSECMRCLDILEKKQTLYFGKRKYLLEKAKKAFCQNISKRDFSLVKDFMNKFSLIIDEQIKNQVTKEAQEMMEECYGEAGSWDPETIRTWARNISELEEDFNIEGRSTELEELANDIEEESKEEYEEYDDYEPDTNTSIKTEPYTSDEELDEIFKNL